MTTITKILVPMDFSEYSAKALKQALEIAQQYRAKVYVLHVVDEQICHHFEDYKLTPESVMGMQNKMIKSASVRLQKQIDKFSQAKELEVIAEVVLGNPSEEILTFQTEKGIDLTVIASLGKTAIAKYLIGGVARNVLKGSKCPVLLTK